MPSVVSSNKCYDGNVTKYKHSSTILNCDMVFNVFLPVQANQGKVPAILYLSGLTCNEDNFITKSGATRFASELGLALICPDTSPRGTGCKDEAKDWNFGLGAAYYLDATTDDYKKHYNMYSYITQEFYSLVTSFLPIDTNRFSICGHSVGGHGALTVGMRNPDKFKCISVFAPVSNPTKCELGAQAYSRFLGPDKSKWEIYDATNVAKTYNDRPMDILVDQGSKDAFLLDNNLLTSNFIEASKNNDKLNVSYCLRAGYDHSYYYVATFIQEHLKWHALRLRQA